MDAPQRSGRWRALAIFLVVAVPCVIAAHELGSLVSVWIAPGEPSPAVPGGLTESERNGLVVSASDLDLGEVWETTEFVHNVSIHNRSGTEKKIEDFSTSCLCTEVEPRTVAIPPGGTVTVHVRIDPNHNRSPDEADLAVRPFAVEVTPILDTSLPQQPGWTIHGRFKSRVTFNALSVHFGEEVVQGSPAPTRRVAATVHVPMQRLEARVEPPSAGTASVTLVPDKPDGLELKITPANTLPIGPFNSTALRWAV